MNDISIISYSPDYQPDFKRLNIEWISRYFTVEPHDLEQLDHPETHIMPNDGQIFFAALDKEIVGCVAVINMERRASNWLKWQSRQRLREKASAKNYALPPLTTSDS